MFLKKLVIENIRSYEKQEIVFPSGAILLSGDIGSGKTTILLAIEFALFGLEPGQKGTSLLRNGENEAKVIIEFELEGKEIIIERTLSRGKKSITQDYCGITIDNEKFEGSVTEIKNKVLSLLNYPQEFAKKTNLLYKFTVYTPQEEMKQIILESGDIRLNTLRHVFGIDKYKRIEENTNLLSSKLREKIRINEGMIFTLDRDKENLENKKTDLILMKDNQKNASIDYEKSIEFRSSKEQDIKDIQEKIDEKRGLETEKAKSSILIHEKDQQNKTLENVIKGLKLQIEESKKISFNEDEFKALDERIEFQQKKEDEMQKEYIQIIGRINSEMSRKKEAENLKNKISAIQKCPTCLQEVSDQYKRNIFTRTDEEIQNTQKNINDLALRKNQLAEQLDFVKKTKEDFNKRKSELELLKIKLETLKEKETRIQETEKQISLIQKDLDILLRHIKTIESTIEEYGKFEKIYEEKTKELHQAKTKENQAAIKNAEINKDIQFLEQQIKEKKEEIKNKEELKKKTERIRELEYWISEKFISLVLFTEKQVMLTLKEEFSKLFSKWFGMLVSDTLNAKLDDDFSPVIEHQDYELDYSFLSGGERTAIALAYRLSLNQVINSLLSNIKTRNLVILDEPTDGFSATQLERMKEVFEELNTEQLILVSHEQKMEDFVDSIIRFTKQNNVTDVVY
jgi:DNA repair protein SbcC/Rad50